MSMDTSNDGKIFLGAGGQLYYKQIIITDLAESGELGVGLPRDFDATYELFGVVTHKGRSSDSGHYIGWVKSDDGIFQN